MTGLVIPSLGGRQLVHCLAAAARIDPPPERIIVVLSGGVPPPVLPAAADLVAVDRRLGFAAAVNLGIGRLPASVRRVALLNDDAAPEPGWLAGLDAALTADPSLGAVQGTVTDGVGSSVDGRGIALDDAALPIQIDRGAPPAPEPSGPRSVLAVSGTASLYRRRALREAALADGSIFDPRYGSYHEDLDLGLRLRRLGWRAAWVPGARSSHLGSVSGRRLGWRHPWWLLGNRWRALAGNLTAGALLAALLVLLRGEVRAVHTLLRTNPRALPTAAAVWLCLPWIVIRALARPSPGPRLTTLPEAV